MSLPFLYLETIGNKCSQFKSHSLLSHLLLILHNFFKSNNSPKNPNHMLTHIVLSSLSFIVINPILTLCYSIMSHATLILRYHASMLTLHTSLITCTLVTTCMILERLECIVDHWTLTM